MANAPGQLVPADSAGRAHIEIRIAAIMDALVQETPSARQSIGRRFLVTAAPKLIDLRADIGPSIRDVRFWPKADLGLTNHDVRF